MTDDGDKALMRALHDYDDGRDWSDWIVWGMNSRRRLSEKAFSVPPARPQVVPASIKPKKKVKQFKKRRVKEVPE